MRLLYAGPQGRIVCREGRWEVVQVWQVGEALEEAGEHDLHFEFAQGRAEAAVRALNYPATSGGVRECSDVVDPPPARPTPTTPMSMTPPRDSRGRFTDWPMGFVYAVALFCVIALAERCGVV